LLAGLRGADYGRRAAFTLPATWLAGSLFGLTPLQPLRALSYRRCGFFCSVRW
jgi:hypothetical protein